MSGFAAHSIRFRNPTYKKLDCGGAREIPAENPLDFKPN
jgi:hypothetical protein